MKNILLLILICGVTLIVSGCWDRVEVNDLAIVTAAAIDKKDDNQIELSLQVFIPKALSGGGSEGGGGMSGGGAVTMVASHKGSNISDALSKLQSEFPRRVFWGHCKVFIFGEKLAKAGIQEHLDFLLRHPQPRERAYVYVSEGKAKPILELLAPLERYSAEGLRELSDLHIGMKVTLQDLDEKLIGIVQAAALPIVDIHPPGKGQEKLQGEPYIAGTAVFKKDKMIGNLTEKETRGILWIRNEIEAYTVTFKPGAEKGEISINPIKASVKLVPEIRNKKWIMVVKIDTEGTIIQNGTNLNLSSPKSIKVVEKAFEKEIEKRIELAFQQTQQELKTDILGFGEEFSRKYPDKWKKNKGRWNEIFPEIELETEIKAHIRRQGYITKPGGMPEKEVKEQ
ncbi:MULTISPECIES: Ger(x)C family spore germination protein [Bacillaceae]|uniref:Spore germination protein KC n=1 Tax=Peribacillus huizhouensis TaxID=1501239 RepID=A0ABR6CT40_9BACI|nr:MULTISPECIES: Ger(x)C family spore germination protein [Bacillaceae]MBA9028202.1 spore germination protein KC [Peribacillus huizhouensis]